MKTFVTMTKKLFSLSAIVSLALVAALSYAQGPPPPTCSGPLCDDLGGGRKCGNYTGICINYQCGPEKCVGGDYQTVVYKLTRYQYTCHYIVYNEDGSQTPVTAACFSKPTISSQPLNSCCGAGSLLPVLLQQAVSQGAQASHK